MIPHPAHEHVVHGIFRRISNGQSSSSSSPSSLSSTTTSSSSSSLSSSSSSWSSTSSSSWYEHDTDWKRTDVQALLLKRKCRWIKRQCRTGDGEVLGSNPESGSNPLPPLFSVRTVGSAHVLSIGWDTNGAWRGTLVFLSLRVNSCQLKTPRPPPLPPPPIPLRVCGTHPHFCVC